MGDGEDDIGMLAQRLRAHVDALAGRIGERNVLRPHALAAAADFIRREWAAQRHDVRAERYRAEGIDCENVEVSICGVSRPGEIVLLGAHYDTVAGSPGADDNASGVAALLEIGRALAGTAPARTIRLVAFVNEEPPFFWSGQMGSQVHARAARRRGDDIRVMLSLEMLGCYSEAPGSQRYPPFLRWFYPGRGNFIAFVSDLGSRRALGEAVRAFRAQSDFPSESLATFRFVPGVAWSDQRSFWREGYRALMVTDTAFYRNPHYHTRLDTPERLDYASMARVVKGLAGTAFALAAADAMVPVER
ncbi:MAG TPA: M28 family peptidase [Casimicrobiaceae bacterium]